MFLETEFEIWESRLSPQQEANLDVPAWFLPALGIYFIGGGAVGLIAFAQAFASGERALLNVGIATILTIVHLVAIWCGVMALQRRRGWLRVATILSIIQVPVLISPIVTYGLNIGVFVAPYVSVPPLRIGLNYGIGSYAQLHLFVPMPYGLGVNLVAFCLALYLFRLHARGTA